MIENNLKILKIYGLSPRRLRLNNEAGQFPSGGSPRRRKRFTRTKKKRKPPTSDDPQKHAKT